MKLCLSLSRKIKDRVRKQRAEEDIWMAGNISFSDVCKDQVNLGQKDQSF
jgi:hypothetical protein